MSNDETDPEEKYQLSQLASDLIVEERTKQLISMTDVMNFIAEVEVRIQIIQRKSGTLQVVLLEGETTSRELRLWAISTLEIIEKFKGKMLAIQHEVGEKW
jgi:pyrroloquinoline quinone (PQQ) biosynthesis protein C